jgi:hypothetical protein
MNSLLAWTVVLVLTSTALLGGLKLEWCVGLLGPAAAIAGALIISRQCRIEVARFGRFRVVAVDRPRPHLELVRGLFKRRIRLVDRHVARRASALRAAYVSAVARRRRKIRVVLGGRSFFLAVREVPSLLTALEAACDWV